MTSRRRGGRNLHADIGLQHRHNLYLHEDVHFSTPVHRSSSSMECVRQLDKVGRYGVITGTSCNPGGSGNRLVQARSYSLSLGTWLSSVTHKHFDRCFLFTSCVFGFDDAEMRQKTDGRKLNFSFRQQGRRLRVVDPTLVPHIL